MLGAIRIGAGARRRQPRHVQHRHVGHPAVGAERQRELNDDLPARRCLLAELLPQPIAEQLVRLARRGADDQQPVHDLIAPAVVRELDEVGERPRPRPVQR